MSFPLKIVGILKSSAPSGYDTDAQAYIDAVHATVADLGSIYGTLTDVQVTDAINQFFLDCKGTGTTTNNTNFYSKFHAVYLMIGSNDTTHSLNAVNPSNTDAAYRLTYGGTGTTHTSDGIDLDGNGYTNTHFNPSTDLTSIYSVSVSIYLQEDLTGLGSDKSFIAGRDGSLNFLNFQYRNVSSGIRVFIYNAVQVLLSSAPTNGHSLACRESSTSLIIRDSNENENLSTSTESGSAPNADLFLGGYNDNGSPITSLNLPATITFAHISSGLTANERQDLYDAVATLQTTLLRNQ